MILRRSLKTEDVLLNEKLKTMQEIKDVLLNEKLKTMQEIKYVLLNEKLKTMQNPGSVCLVIGQNIKNVISILKDLLQCLEAGEDWCSAAKVDLAIECLEEYYEITKT